MSDNKTATWHMAAQAIVNAGMAPYEVGDTLIGILQELMDDEQADFVKIFSEKPSLNLQQIKEKSGWEEEAILKMLDSLMHGGVVVGTTSKSTGIMVYRLLGPVPGLFEYTNLRGETDDKHKRMARLFEKLADERRQIAQENYDTFSEAVKVMPPLVRIVPIEEEIGEAGDKIMPTEEVSGIIDKFDDITLAHCYCRHAKDLLDKSCKVTDERLNCILLGKSARFAADYKFGKAVTREEAKQELAKAADEGLVHKAFHIHLSTELDEEAICNCCKCCCGPFQSYHKGISPYHCYSSYLAEVNIDTCTACEECVELCPVDAIEIVDMAAFVKNDGCIGCGVCAHQCAEESIQLLRTESRSVFLPLKRVKNVKSAVN